MCIGVWIGVAHPPPQNPVFTPRQGGVMSTQDHLVVVTYDVSDPKRWRRLYKLMLGYGEWLQLSVFQCRLDRARMAVLEGQVAEIIQNGEDHVLMLDLGPADTLRPNVRSLGKSFQAVRRQSVIV